MKYDFEFLLLSHDIIKPEYFSNDVLSWFFTAMRDYYLDYQARITDEGFRNELKKLSQRKQLKNFDSDLYLRTYVNICKAEVEEKEYIKNELVDFCKYQTIKQALLDCPKILETRDFERVENILQKALRTGEATYDIGNQYFISWPQRLAARNKEEKILPTGITKLDELLNGGIKSKQLGLWMAPTSRGKSLALVHCGKRAILMKKKVVYYTFELSEDEVAERYDSSFSRIKVNKLAEDEVKLSSCLEHLGKSYGNSLVIKYFPMHGGTIDNIKSHLIKCTAAHFEPDLVLVDYLDLLKPIIKRTEKRTELSDIAAGLKSLATEMDFPIWSATQSNRGAYSKEVHDEENIGEDIGKAQIVDLLITFNQTKENIADGKMKLYLAKNRNGPKGLPIDIHTDFSRMCFYDPPHDGEDNSAVVKDVLSRKVPGKDKSSPKKVLPVSKRKLPVVNPNA